ncbi:MAG: ABC transporter permease [Polyangiaceae bacterium]
MDSEQHLAMMGVFMASYGGFASAIRSEQAMGTLESLLMSPIRIPTLVLGANMWTMVFAVLDAALTLGVGALVFGLSFHSNWVAAATIVVLTNMSFVAVGVLSAAFAVVYKTRRSVSSRRGWRVVLAWGGNLSGRSVAMVARDRRLAPSDHPWNRRAPGGLIGGHSLSAFTTQLLVLFGFAAIGLPCSIVIFKRALVQAKRDGTLLQY